MDFPVARRDLHAAASDHLPLSARSRTWKRPALTSALLHGLIIALLIVRVALAPTGHLSPPPPLAEVELVQLNSPAVGGAPRPPEPAHATSARHPPPAPPPMPPAPQASAPPAAAAANPGGAPAARPAPPPPQAPAPPVSARVPALAAAQPAEPPPDVRLDITGDIGTGLVAGKQVIPAKLDAGFHNAPPAYPPAAARRGEEGVVELLIHVAPDGTAASVEVTKSSGHPILDRAARDAVARWHFRPAEQNGVPVRSDLPFNVHFELGRQGDQWSE